MLHPVKQKIVPLKIIGKIINACQWLKSGHYLHHKILHNIT